ncbi:MAG: RHS repeat-associated core domain-containing protein [Bacteroidota bacterium]
MTNHLGNVMATVSDRVVSYNDDDPLDPQYRAYIRSSQDYYPFGLRMQDRQFEWQFDNYRFGFNGKEGDKDDEWGAQTHYDYGFRIYNPSIARFLSVDPLAPDYPWYTPYQFAGNMPIWAIDVDGLEPEITSGKKNEKTIDGGNPLGELDLTVKAKRVRKGEIGIDEPFERECTNCPTVVADDMKLQNSGVGVVTANFEWNEAEGSVGEAEGFEAVVPLVGSGRSAINAFQNDRYISGIFYSVMTVGDFFFVKSLGQGSVRLAYALRYEGGWRTGVSKLYNIGYDHKWGNVVGHWEDLGLLNTPLNIAGLNGVKHHSLMARHIADANPLLAKVLGNQTWNIKSFSIQGNKTVRYSHIWAAHSTGTNPAMKHFLTLRYQVFATPNWYKGVLLSGTTRYNERRFLNFSNAYNF